MRDYNNNKQNSMLKRLKVGDTIFVKKEKYFRGTTDTFEAVVEKINTSSLYLDVVNKKDTKIAYCFKRKEVKDVCFGTMFYFFKDEQDFRDKTELEKKLTDLEAETTSKIQHLVENKNIEALEKIEILEKILKNLSKKNSME